MSATTRVVLYAKLIQAAAGKTDQATVKAEVVKIPSGYITYDPEEGLWQSSRCHCLDYQEGAFSKV